ncbi:MAG: hypothetical protein PF495_17295 [Spirochaetales bacterium]|jgi:hypothetical protein|nr:hypothetical protein [Spirochaetales bacterium]
MIKTLRTIALKMLKEIEIEADPHRRRDRVHEYSMFVGTIGNATELDKISANGQVSTGEPTVESDDPRVMDGDITPVEPVDVPAPPVTVEPVVVSAPPVTVEPVDTTELDADGQPWDARIHGKKRAKIGTGTWKLIRGIDPATVEAVRAEYSAAETVSAPPAADVPTPPVSAGDITSQSVTARITDLTSNKKLSVIDMMKLLKTHGVQNIPDLNNHPESLQNIWDALVAIV